jgi:hypothetical protein
VGGAAVNGHARLLCIALAAQLLDLITWPPAIVHDPSGELAPWLRDATATIEAKVVGIAIMAVILVAIPRLPRLSAEKRQRWAYRAAVLVAAVGLFGAGTNVAGWA